MSDKERGDGGGLKPCPFCGSQPVPRESYIPNSVACPFGHTSPMLPSEWNRRPAPAPVERDAVIEKCRLVLENLDPFQASEGSKDISCYCCGAWCRDGMTRPDHGEDCDYWNAVKALRALKSEGGKG